MDIILQGIDNVICYIDDILISGKTEEEHLKTLSQVLSRFQKYGVHMKRSKCFFLRECVQYLGHSIDANGVHATEEKIKAIVEAPVPKNLAELQSFLGLLNYYGRFILNLSTLLHPLNELLRKETAWKWSSAQDNAFQNG